MKKGTVNAEPKSDMLRPLSPKHHLTPALSPISWRRGRRIRCGSFELQTPNSE
jgi:hypothetical protein